MASSFSEALTKIKMSPIVSISEEVRSIAPQFQKESGKNFLMFQRGEIDFPTPKYIVEAAKQALDSGFTKYPKSGGEKELKEVIVEKLASYNNAKNLEPQNVVATYGGQEALELSFKLFEGKKGAGFAPTWSCVLENFIPYSRVDFTQVPLNEDFSIDFAGLEKVLKESAFFYLNTPQNPTGKLFSEDEVRRIVELCEKYDTYLISDEAYEMIVYENHKHFSPLSIESDKILSAFTFSKTFSMTGWRLGYLVTRNKEINEIIKLGNYTQTAGVTTFVQHAGIEALRNKDEYKKALDKIMTEFSKRREAMYNGFNSIDGIEVEKPFGGFYFFPNFKNFIPQNVSGGDREVYIYNKLLEKGIAAVYGSCFGKYFTDNIRFSFSTTPVEIIEEGIERMKELFNK